LSTFRIRRSTARSILVIIEHVSEHVADAVSRGARRCSVSEAGGYCSVTTPFLIRLHEAPTMAALDGDRPQVPAWLIGGFPLDPSATGSWAFARLRLANLYRFMAFRPRFHSLKNEPGFPLGRVALRKA